MTFDFTPAKRENIPLLIGLAGSSGSGKTFSALQLAKGLAGGERFVVIDTEAGRAKHYADHFAFDHGDLMPPFRPDAYTAAINAADAKGYPVIVVDSTSHAWAGEGGCLDWHEEELQRMAGDDWKKRDVMNMAAWVKPKGAHRRFLSRLLQVRAHLILCFRAEQKVDMVKNPQTGKTEIVPKKLLSGHVDWIPICEKNTLYELTISLLLTADSPGVPKPVKLEADHRPMVPLDQPLSEQVGRALAEWAAGAEGFHQKPGARPAETTRTDSEADTLAAIEQRLLEHAELTGNEAIGPSIEKARAEKSEAQFAVWLRTQGRKLDEKLAGVS